MRRLSGLRMPAAAAAMRFGILVVVASCFVIRGRMNWLVPNEFDSLKGVKLAVIEVHLAVKLRLRSRELGPGSGPD